MENLNKNTIKTPKKNPRTLAIFVEHGITFHIA